MGKGISLYEIFNNIEARKREYEEKLRLLYPPPEVHAWMEQKVKETADMNKGRLDTQSFRLGMLAMWLHLKKEKLI